MDDPLEALIRTRGILKLYITKRCNLGCSMCDNWKHHPPPGEELDTGQWRSIITEARRIGYEKVVFFGGEPTLRRDLVELVGHAYLERFRIIRLYTHAFNLNPARIDALLEAGVNRFSVSVDSARFEVNDRIRGQAGAGARSSEVVRYLRTRRGDYPRVRVQVNATIQRDTFRDLPLLFDAAHEWGADTVTMTPLIAKGEAGTLLTIRDSMLTMAEQAEYSTRIAPVLWDKACTFGYGLSLEDVFVYSDHAATPRIADYQLEYPCFIPWTRLIVREDGTVVGCNKIAPRLQRLGHIRDGSVVEIRDSPDAMRFRESCLSTGTFPKMEGCENCCFGQAAENRDIARALGYTAGALP